MSEFEFVAQMTQALAWPVFALLGVLVLRRPLRQMLSHRPPSKVKAGPFEVEWDSKISETETEIAPTDLAVVPSGMRDELGAQAATAPAVAVLAAHAALDRTLRELLSATELSTQDIRRAGNAVGLARLAHQQGLVTIESVRAVEGVTVLRNLAAHGSAREITTEQASEYLTLVDAILFALRAGT